MSSKKHDYRVAVVSSGVHHVKRGIETWAIDLSAALIEYGVDATLVTGSGPSLAPYEKAIPCMQRGSKSNAFITRWSPKFLWRWHLTADYPLEQMTFALSFVLGGHAKNIDIIHTQDPVVATIFEWFRKKGLIKAKTLLAHGTEESLEALSKYQYLQHLAPFHMVESEPVKKPDAFWVVVPNFVNLSVFSPSNESPFRESLGISKDATVFLCVAAIKKDHKRIDYLINEFSAYHAQHKGDAHLIVAGASHPDTKGLVEQANALCPSNIHFLQDQGRELMPAIFNAADVFVMTSLKEMMPIALLEAISSGLPCLVSTHPVVTSMIGDGGESIDMNLEGRLSEALAKWSDETLIKQTAIKARNHAENNYSKEAVTNQLFGVYTEMLK